MTVATAQPQNGAAVRPHRKSAYVTGGTRGIGLAIAKRLAGDGYAVTVCGASAAGVRSCIAVTEDSGLDITVERVDVCDDGALAAALEGAGRRASGLDLLVCCAGGPVLGTADELDLRDLDRCLDLNLRSVYVSVRSALPQIRLAGGGSIVLISSIWARTTTTERAAYTAAKTAVTGLARALAIDHAGEGIRVNCVAPGYVDTALLRRSLGAEEGGVDDAVRRLHELHPLGRLVEPDDIANAVAFLASDAARNITGQTLYVDGGISLRLRT